MESFDPKLSSSTQKFKEVLQDVSDLWKWCASIAALPFFASIISLQPPWPPYLAPFAALVQLIGIMICFDTLRSASVRKIKQSMWLFTFVFLTTCVLYLIAISAFVIEEPSKNLRFAIGFVCKEEVKNVYPTECPNLSKSHLKDAEWNPHELWTSWSITTVNMLLIVLWLTSFMSLAGLVGSFLIGQNRLPRRRKAS